VKTTRSTQDKADVYSVLIEYYDNGMTQFDKKIVAGIGTSRQEAERIVKAKLHSMAESFRLTPQS
jgi:hypothetical protein